ncbi:MAG: hypothetical protein HUJ97_00585 [Bacteroidales bacterium]|nr:hypothetical protein [Bacteroidales bacterium]
MIQPRLDYIDLAKGLGVILMLAAHIDSFILKDWTYSFHMPLFFVISGFCSNKKVVSKAFVSGVRSLLLPYIVVCLSIVFYFLCFQIANNYIKGSPFYLYQLTDYLVWIPFSWGCLASHDIGIGVVWFLWAMFWGRIWKSLIDSYFPTNIRLFVSVLLFITAIYLPIGPYNFWGFKQGMQATVFLMLGASVKELDIFNNKNSCIWLGLCVLFLFASKYPIDMSWWKYPLGIYNILTASILSLSFIWLCSNLDRVDSSHLSIFRKGLYYIGRNSLFFLCAECFILSTQLLKPVMSMPFGVVFFTKLCLLLSLCFLISRTKIGRYIFKFN